VTRSEIESYLDEWHDAFEAEHGHRPAASTTKLRIDALRSFYRYLDDRDMLVDDSGAFVRNPVDRIKAPKVRRKPNDWLRGEEEHRLFSTEMAPHERMIIHLLRGLGLRTGEATGLLVSDIHLDDGYAHIRKSKSDAGLREVPISNDLAFELRAWLRHLDQRGLLAQHRPLLSTTHGTPMANQFVWRIVKRVGVRAGLRVVEGSGVARTTTLTPRTLRKTFGSHLLNEGMALKSVSLLLGHQNTTITEDVYAELLPSTVEKEFRSITD
jgi:integrase/recombinase XerD